MADLHLTYAQVEMLATAMSVAFDDQPDADGLINGYDADAVDAVDAMLRAVLRRGPTESSETTEVICAGGGE